MNRIRSFPKNLCDVVIANRLRQKLFLILLLILFSFVYVMFFAPPKTEDLPVYNEISQKTSQKITGKTPLELPMHFGAGEAIGVVLYFDKPEYMSADKYDIQIKDGSGNSVFSSTFSAQSLNKENNQLSFGLTNMGKAGGDYTLSITGKNIPEKTAVSLFVRQLNGVALPQADITYSLGISPNVLTFSFWIVVAGCILILFYSKKMHVNVLVAVLVFGILFALITPILDVPDEPVHLGTAFQVSSLDLFGTTPGGAWVSSSQDQLTQYHLSQLTLVDNPLYGTTIQDGLTQSNLGDGQFFLGYVPAAIVISVCRALHAGVLPMFYAGRIINLIVYALLAFLAIKTAPRYKIFFAVIALMPMALFIAGSYNQDFLTFGLALLLAAYFTKLYFAKGLVIGYREIIRFTVLCAVLCMVKYSLLPLCLLLLFIPASRFASRKTKVFGSILYFIVPVIAGVGLFLMIQSIIAASATGSESALTADGVNMMGASMIQQLHFMMNSLTTAVSIFLRAFVENSPSYITKLFTFGWFSYNIPTIFIYIYVGFIALTGFIYSKYEHSTALFAETKLGFRNKSGVLIMLICGFVLMNLLMYLTWTPVGANFIEGVQGRYFIPLLLFLPFLSSNASPVMDEDAVLKKHFSITFVAQLFIVLSLIQTLFRYY